LRGQLRQPLVERDEIRAERSRQPDLRRIVGVAAELLCDDHDVSRID
jgi:hypothetical protein